MHMHMHMHMHMYMYVHVLMKGNREAMCLCVWPKQKYKCARVPRFLLETTPYVKTLPPFRVPFSREQSRAATPDTTRHGLPLGFPHDG